jgi:uncharacterized protein (TIGR03083 family)
VEPAAYLDHLQVQGAALAAAARRAPEAPVPSCPDWDMKALVAHAGRIFYWVDQIVREKSATYVKAQSTTLEDFDAIVSWYEGGLAAVLGTLGATDPAEAVWNWYDRGPAPAAFWYRRMAHETTIHRWDADNAAAAGQAGPIPPDLAGDGIDEYLSFVGGWLARKPIAGLHGSLHLHATDAEGEWSMDLRPDGLDLAREHRKSDAAIRAPVSDLYLWMLNRVPADGPTLQCFGDEAIVASWRRLEF